MSFKKCEICGRVNAEILRPMPGWQSGYGLPEMICYDCMEVWYDQGETDPIRIREIVLSNERRKNEDSQRSV